MKPFLVAIDLDRTLLDCDGKLPRRNRATLHAAHLAGHRIVLCTGRTLAETRPILQQIDLDLDAAITVGGALISSVADGRTLRRIALRGELSRELAGWLRERGYPVVWIHDPTEYGFDGYLIRRGPMHPALERWLAMVPCKIRVFDDLPASTEGALRVSVVDDTPTLRRLAGPFADRFASRVNHNVIDVPSYSFTVLEAFERSVDKWNAVRALCDLWHLPPADTIALGDDVNDVTMLREAGCGVAVANAHPDALAAAHRTTAANDDCGVALALEDLLNLKPQWD